MPVVNRIADYAPQMTEWRRYLHTIPELWNDCFKTAAFVAERLSADLVDVTYLEVGGIGRLSASGSVLLVSPSDSAQADSADYDFSARELRMRGNVLLNQGAISLSADLLTIDLETGGAVMEGRVRTVLPSGSK